MKRAHAFLLLYILAVGGFAVTGQNKAEAAPPNQQVQGDTSGQDQAFARGAIFNVFEQIRRKEQADAVLLLVRDMGDGNADLSGFPKGQAFLDEPLQVTIYLVFERSLLPAERHKLMRLLGIKESRLPVPICLLVSNGAISGFSSGGKDCGAAILAYGGGGER